MQYDFNIELKDLAGETIKDGKGDPLTIGKLLANTLVNQGKGDAMKFHNWALDMYNCRVLNLDNSDKRVLTEFVENSETLTVLAKAQIIDYITSKKND